MRYVSSYSHSKNKTEVKLDLSNYAKKSDLKNPTGVETSQFAKKYDLVNLKSEFDKLNIDKLEKLSVDEFVSVPTDLSKLSHAVKNDVVKNIEYNAKILKIKYPVLLT